MDPQSLGPAGAPIVLVLAAGLLIDGIQAKDFRLSDRLTTELRNPAVARTAGGR